jgi:prepilin-type N-terminal cleavage/methylation domain-containing protein
MHETKHPDLAPTHTARERGFSMAEVLVAVALLSVILLALFGLVTAGVQRAYGGRKMTQATILAESVMERANVEAPYTLLGAASTATTATYEWTMSNGIVTPAAEGGSGIPVTERNAWRTAFANSQLPSISNSTATLTVTMTPLPDTGTPRTFGNAAIVRILVDVTWFEGVGATNSAGKRRRTVRLQALNVRSANL